MNKLIFFLIFTLSILGCDDLVRFEKPQPLGRNNLNQFPKRLRGTYFLSSEGRWLRISATQIIEGIDIELNTLIDSLDLEIDSANMVEEEPGFIRIDEGNLSLSLRLLSNDSVRVNYVYVDTIFNISDRHILRRFKGHYFLNHQIAENDWWVRRLTLDKGELSFSRVTLPEDITELEEVTEVDEIESDGAKNISYKLNPSRKELKELMKHNFSETLTYTKVKK